MKWSGFVMLLALSLVVSLPAWAGGFPYPGPAQNVNTSLFVTNASQICEPIGGVLFTDIGFMPLGSSGTNQGQAYGDLEGPVAATVLGTHGGNIGCGPTTCGYDVQHYWVHVSGGQIWFKQGWLKPSAVTPTMGHTAGTVDATLTAVRWGDYVVEWEGGTGKFANTKGYGDFFGEADFVNNTLVLRYRGMMCRLISP